MTLQKLISARVVAVVVWICITHTFCNAAGTSMRSPRALERPAGDVYCKPPIPSKRRWRVTQHGQDTHQCHEPPGKSITAQHRLPSHTTPQHHCIQLVARYAHGFWSNRVATARWVTLSNPSNPFKPTPKAMMLFMRNHTHDILLPCITHRVFAWGPPNRSQWPRGDDLPHAVDFGLHV